MSSPTALRPNAATAESAAIAQLRVEVRQMLAVARAKGEFAPTCDSWLSGFSRPFSQALGARGWIASMARASLAWPERESMK